MHSSIVTIRLCICIIPQSLWMYPSTLQCKSWYHMACVGVDKKKKVNKKGYKCQNCRDKDAAARAAGTLVEEVSKPQSGIESEFGS